LFIFNVLAYYWRKDTFFLAVAMQKFNPHCSRILKVFQKLIIHDGEIDIAQ
jgi:hypothetical protein